MLLPQLQLSFFHLQHSALSYCPVIYWPILVCLDIRLLQTLLLCTKLQWSISFPNHFPSLKSLLRTDPRSGITDLGGLSWTAARHLDSSPRDFKALPSAFHTVGLFLVPFRVINSKYLKSQENRLGRILQNQNIFTLFF